MLTDIAKACGSEQGIGDGMENDVCIAVTCKSAAVRNLDAAEHERSITRESVDVEAEAGARAGSSGKPLLGTFEVGSEGQLLERRITFDRSDAHAGGAKHAGFIGGRGTGPLVVSSPDVGEPEGLRCLDPDDCRPVHGITERLAGFRQCIADGENGRCPFEEFKARKEAIDDCKGAKGPGGIVNHDGIGRDRSEACADRIGTFGTADLELGDIQALKCRLRLFLLSFANDDPHRLYRRMADKRFDRPAQHGFAAEHPELLGNAAAHAGAASGSDNECSRGHGGAV